MEGCISSEWHSPAPPLYALCYVTCGLRTCSVKWCLSPVPPTLSSCLSFWLSQFRTLSLCVCVVAVEEEESLHDTITSFLLNWSNCIGFLFICLFYNSALSWAAWKLFSMSHRWQQNMHRKILEVTPSPPPTTTLCCFLCQPSLVPSLLNACQTIGTKQQACDMIQEASFQNIVAEHLSLPTTLVNYLLHL